MAGFILGTGGGVLAAAAVYYTISASISSSTAIVRSELHNSSTVLESSFDPQTPLPPSSFIGPSHPYQPRFSDTLRFRWNLAVGRAVDSVRETNWSSMGMVVLEEGKGLAGKLGGQVSAVTGEVKDKLVEGEGKVKEAGEKVKEFGEGIERRVESEMEILDGGFSSVGVTGGDLRTESFTGGSGVWVKTKREEEKRAEGRLV